MANEAFIAASPDIHRAGLADVAVSTFHDDDFTWVLETNKAQVFGVLGLLYWDGGLLSGLLRGFVLRGSLGFANVFGKLNEILLWILAVFLGLRPVGKSVDRRQDAIDFKANSIYDLEVESSPGAP